MLLSEVSAAAYLAELQALAGSDLLAGCWVIEPAAAWAKLGWPQLADVALRRQLDWYGPIEPWRDPLLAVDQIELDRQPDGSVSVALVQAGRRLVNGMRLQRGWLDWIAEQVALRAGCAADGASVDGLQVDAICSADGALIGLTIAMVTDDLPQLHELVRSGALSAATAELLTSQIGRGGSVLVAGGRASGKSLVLAALATAVAERRQLLVLDAVGRPMAGAVPWPWPAQPEQQARQLAQLVRRCNVTALIDDGAALAAPTLWRAVLAGLPLLAAVAAPSVVRGLALVEQRCAAAAPALPALRALLTAAFDGMTVLELGPTQEGRLTVVRSGEVLRSAAGQLGEPFTIEWHAARPVARVEEERWNW